MTLKDAPDGGGDRRKASEDGRRKPSRVELAAELDALAERVAALEQEPRRPPARALAAKDLLPALRELGADGGEASPFGGAVMYAGVGPRDGGELTWQIARRWVDVLRADRARSGRALGALGSPARVDIVGELLTGPLTRRELRARLSRSTAGQLNHHLRELLAAGLVEQPSRGVYQVPGQHVVPILTLLSCAVDLASDATEPA
jgi:DNA-binding HxlR family transcriptional regulator